MASVKNISTGPRGAYFEGVLKMADPGAVIEADDFEPEWFEEVGAVGGAEAKPKAAPSPATKAKPSKG
jgi:hypothetical protein